MTTRKKQIKVKLIIYGLDEYNNERVWFTYMAHTVYLIVSSVANMYFGGVRMASNLGKT